MAIYGGIDMSRNRLAGMCLPAFSVLIFSIFVAPPARCQVLEAPEKVQPEQQL